MDYNYLVMCESPLDLNITIMLLQEAYGREWNYQRRPAPAMLGRNYILGSNMEISGEHMEALSMVVFE